MKKYIKRILIQIVCSSSFIANAASIHVDFDRETQRTQININGEITTEDGDRFSNIAHRYQEAIVNLNSPGGSLLSGIQIGTIIRLRAFSTVVKSQSICASACAYAWLAGVQRYAEDNSSIGFHAAYVMERGAARESGVGNALLGSYLARIGLTDEAIAYFTSAQPDELNWLNGSVAKKIKLNVYDFASIKLATTKPRLPGVSATPTPTPTPTQTTNLDLASRHFVKNLLAYWSADNDAALKYLTEALADQVYFYGKTTDRALIVKEKMNAIKRWPIRVYVERPSSLVTDCNNQTKTCTISGLLDWDARSPEKNRVSSGVAQFEYQLDFKNGSPKIVAETSNVLERK